MIILYRKKNSVSFFFELLKMLSHWYHFLYHRVYPDIFLEGRRKTTTTIRDGRSTCRKGLRFKGLEERRMRIRICIIQLLAKIVAVFQEDRNSFMHSCKVIYRSWPGKFSSFNGFGRITVILPSVLDIVHHLGGGGGCSYHNCSNTGSVLPFRWTRKDYHDECRPLSNSAKPEKGWYIFQHRHEVFLYFSPL